MDAVQLLRSLQHQNPKTTQQQFINKCVEALMGRDEAAEYISRLYETLEEKSKQAKSINNFLTYFNMFVYQQPTEQLRHLLKDVLPAQQWETNFHLFFGQLTTAIRKQVVSLAFCHEDEQNIPHTVSKLAESSYGKVRYVGGWAVAKTKHALMSAVRRAIDRSLFETEHKRKQVKVEILETLTGSQSHIVHTTVYPTSLHETVRRQNLTGGLTNITDRCFEFFLMFEENRLSAYQRNKIHGEDVLENVKKEMLHETDILEKFKLAVVMADLQLQVSVELVEEVFMEVADCYLRATDKEFVRRHLEQCGKKKTMELRKNVLLSIFSLDTDDRDTLLSKLKTAVKDGCLEKLRKANISAISEKVFSKHLPMKLTKPQMISKVGALLLQEPVAGSSSASDFVQTSPPAHLSQGDRATLKGKGKRKGKRKREANRCPGCDKMETRNDELISCSVCQDCWHRTCCTEFASAENCNAVDNSVQWLCTECR